MKKTTLLKQMLRAPELLVAPGAYDKENTPVSD